MTIYNFMTILNINKYYFIKGGAERFFFELGKLFEKHGHKVVSFSTRHKNNFKTPYEKYFVSEVVTDKISFGWSGMRTVARFFWSCSARRKIKQLIAVEKPNLAIIHNIYHQISPSILPVLKKHNIPLVLIAHDYALLSPNYNMFVRNKVYDKICGSGWLKCLADRCVKNSFIISLICGLETFFHHAVLNIYKKNIDLIICPSKFMYTKFVQADWTEEKLMQIPYFISQKRLNTKALKHSNKKYILYFGRLSIEKGVDVLIDAMRNLPDIKLKIVGSGPEKMNYELRIMNYGLKNIEILDYKSDQELNEIIAQAKFIVAPSLWYENYPLSVLEAYALGVPALVADSGGLPEMIPARDKKFIFSPGDSRELTRKIKFLWENEDSVNQMGEKVKQFIEKNNESERYYSQLMALGKKIK